LHPILEQQNPIAATAYTISEYSANYIQHSAIGQQREILYATGAYRSAVS
jgi:hypothetical protein